MAEVEAWMKANWRKPMHGVVPEIVRREFVNVRLEKFIPLWQAQADEISAELKSLAK
jgi:hypothetical protein